jgi:outer membrane immunogenic protein
MTRVDPANPKFTLGRIMKNILVASLAGLALASTSALAADMSMPMPMKAPAAPPPPAYSWTGCYVDAGGGYALWNQDHYLEDLPSATALSMTTTDGGRGWLGRFGAGCDYQVGHIFNGALVVGAFGDYDAVDTIKGTLNEPAVGIAGSENLTSAWSAGARIGYAVTPSMLWYFDGGYTEARFDQVNFFTTFPVVATGAGIAATTYHGWFLGSGTDTSLASLLPGLPPGLFLRSEFRFSSFSARDDAIIVTATGASTGLGEHVTTNMETITTALVWKFNWMGH